MLNAAHRGLRAVAGRLLPAAVLVLALCPLARAQEEEPVPEFHAPDGVLYDNEESSRLMEMESLSGNLLSNGSFENGRYWPYGWWPMDKLSTYWVEGGTDGKRCLRIWTAMDDEQWSANEKAMRAAVDAVIAKGLDPQKLAEDPRPAAPEPKLARPPYYSSVGGLHGVHYRSEYIDVKPGAVYRFSVDCRNGGRLKGGKAPEVKGEDLPGGGTGTPRVFVKGFFTRTRDTRDGEQLFRANIYRAPMILDPCDTQWRRYARLLHPARSTGTFEQRRVAVEQLQVQLYAYWPIGNYYFDNVRLEIVAWEDPPEMDPVPDPDREPAEEPPPPLGEDEFPVFE